MGIHEAVNKTYDKIICNTFVRSFISRIDKKFNIYMFLSKKHDAFNWQSLETIHAMQDANMNSNL